MMEIQYLESHCLYWDDAQAVSSAHKANTIRRLLCTVYYHFVKSLYKLNMGNDIFESNITKSAKWGIHEINLGGFICSYDMPLKY